MLEHAGEISFPGGTYESTDKNLLETALRETEEEIGISRKEITIIGSLKNTVSISMKTVTPYIGIINAENDELNFHISKDEVEEVILVPVEELLNPSNNWKEKWIRNKKLTTMYFYIYNNHIIWGLTGKIIFKLFKYKYKQIKEHLC